MVHPKSGPLTVFHAKFDIVHTDPMDNTPMKAIELVGEIDEQHRLRAQVPEGLAAGPVRLIVLLQDEDEAGDAWQRGVASEWASELKNTDEDIYTLEDGKPLDAPR